MASVVVSQQLDSFGPITRSLPTLHRRYGEPTERLETAIDFHSLLLPILVSLVVIPEICPKLWTSVANGGQSLVLSPGSFHSLVVA